MRAIEDASFAGVPVNVILLFSTGWYQAAADADLRGLERRVAAGLLLDVRPVASLLVSRWGRAVVGEVPAALFAWGFVSLGIAAGAGVAAVCMLLPETVHEAWQQRRAALAA